jgi:hypothetical protein
MTFDDMHDAWNSPANRMNPERQSEMAKKFLRQLMRRRRFQTIWLANTFILLTVITGLALSNVVSGKFNPASEWGAIAVLFVPWFFAIHFLRRHLRPSSPQIKGEMAIHDSLRASLLSNLEECRRSRWMGMMYLIMAPLLAVAVAQLHRVGKVSTREEFSMILFFAGVLLLSASGVAIRYFAKLLPRQRNIRRLLEEVASGPAN